MLIKRIINDSIADKLLITLKETGKVIANLYREVRGVRQTHAGEVMVYQVNEPGTVGDGVNRKNKDGVLVLGDDGGHLRNIRVDPDGTTIVRHDGPIEVVPHLTEVQGAVTVKDTVTVRPVVVSNMPTEVRVQEGLTVSIIPIQVQVLPFNSADDLEVVLIPGPCRVYSLRVFMAQPGQFEIPGMCGSITTDRFEFNVYPSSVSLDRLVINRLSHNTLGGYLVYTDADGSNTKGNEPEEEISIKDMMENANEYRD